MKTVRALFSAVCLATLASACAHGAAASRTPTDPTEGTLSQVSSVEPAPPPTVLAPTLGVNHDDGAWSNIWTAAAPLPDRGRVAR